MIKCILGLLIDLTIGTSLTKQAEQTSLGAVYPSWNCSQVLSSRASWIFHALSWISVTDRLQFATCSCSSELTWLSGQPFWSALSFQNFCVWNWNIFLSSLGINACVTTVYRARLCYPLESDLAYVGSQPSYFLGVPAQKRVCCRATQTLNTIFLLL